ncbi:MAG: alpha/beta hydrolase [Alphaproteobacteria bacterium]|nr:alpha/beta hydrolase [Alphaproteobacteria bacterium]
MHFKASDGLKIAYTIDDFSPPWKPKQTLLLLHPAMACKERWFSWVPRLAQYFRVVRMDLRGHGESGVPPQDEPLLMERLVQDVREFLAEIGCEQAHCVGNSAGGYILQRLALDSPRHVKTLALFASTPGLKQSNAASWVKPIRERGLRAFLAATIRDRFPPETDPGLVEWYLDQVGRNDDSFIIKFVTLMTQQDYAAEMGNIKCPTLVVIPGGGTVSPEFAYEPMRKNIPDVTVKVYPNVPHTICDYMARDCVDDLLDFLSRKIPPGEITFDRGIRMAP